MPHLVFVVTDISARARPAMPLARMQIASHNFPEGRPNRMKVFSLLLSTLIFTFALANDEDRELAGAKCNGRLVKKLVMKEGQNTYNYVCIRKSFDW